MRKRLAIAAFAAVFPAAPPAAPLGGSPGFIGQVEFPMEFFGARSAWPATPGIGLAYEIPVHEKVVWTLGLVYAYKVFDYRIVSGDSDRYATVFREGSEIYDFSLDQRTRGHFAAFQATPELIAWRHFQFGIGYHAGGSYTRSEGHSYYSYWYPERKSEVRETSSRYRFRLDWGYAWHLGARLGPIRLRTRLGGSDDGYGFNLDLIYYPWLRPVRPAP